MLAKFGPRLMSEVGCMAHRQTMWHTPAVEFSQKIFPVLRTVCPDDVIGIPQCFDASIVIKRRPKSRTCRTFNFSSYENQFADNSLTSDNCTI